MRKKPLPEQQFKFFETHTGKLKREDKDKARSRIAAQTQFFLDSGGKVTKVKTAGWR